ncbi:Ubiquinone biosynthesis protein [Desmophyllum pertusum]|uniref:Ubiquinone biosynthesis protein COQ4 homolog, mitochondrial n=1 Tax=Desmophyllum pertusum TaxID=174260 RepID=A0A9X0CWG8_9CNID|nr:Ubiquinone biosynthesis protein [Desmophyllum pertusum]
MAAVGTRRVLKLLLNPWRHSKGKRFVSAGLEFEDGASDYTAWPEEDEESYHSTEDAFQLYESHVPTSVMQKVLLTAGSAVMALYDPTRSDMIATLGETTGRLALKNMHRRMMQDPVGQQILQECPRLNSSIIDIDKLRQLPDGLFGREYVRGLDTNRITPDSRDEVKFIDDKDLAYVMQRYREVHDFVHTLAGLSVSVPHEIAVKWYEMIQTGLPMCALSSFVAPVRLTSRERTNLRKFYIPWAVYCGYQSKFFMNVYFEKHFEEPIRDLQERMNFVPAPKIQKKSSDNTRV